MIQEKINNFVGVSGKSKELEEYMGICYKNIIAELMNNDEDTLDMVELNFGWEPFTFPDIMVPNPDPTEVLMFDDDEVYINEGVALFMLDSFVNKELLSIDELETIQLLGFDGVLYVGCLDKLLCYVSLVDLSVNWFYGDQTVEMDGIVTELTVSDVFALNMTYTKDMLRKAYEDWWLLNFKKSCGITYKEYWKKVEHNGLPQKLTKLTGVDNQKAIIDNLTGLSEKFDLHCERSLPIINNGHAIDCVLKVRNESDLSVVFDIVSSVDDPKVISERCVAYRMPGVVQVNLLNPEDNSVITFNTITGEFRKIDDNELSIGLPAVAFSLSEIFE